MGSDFFLLSKVRQNVGVGLGMILGLLLGKEKEENIQKAIMSTVKMITIPIGVPKSRIPIEKSPKITKIAKSETK